MGIKIGVIGCGKIAQVRHIPEYLDNEDAELYGLYDINQERANELAGKYHCKTYASEEELLADPEIEAVSICAANYAHAKSSIAALKAGKHVLCEKPMAVTIEECEEMVRAAEESGKILMIGQNQRLAKGHVKARDLIAAGEIGRVLTFRTTFGHGGPETWSVDSGNGTWFFDKKRAAMGAMADLGIHKTDLIQYLLGEKIVQTQAVLSTLDKRDASGELIGVDDNAVCIYTMESGAVGTMTASWTYYGREDNSTVIYGTRGMLKLYEDPRYAIELICANGEKVYYDLEQIQTNDSQTKSGIIDSFICALKDGKEPEISGKSVLSAMKAVFASIESSEKGQAVRIK